MGTFLSPSYSWSSKGLAIVRIIIGLLILLHGIEVFNPQLMAEYAGWEVFGGQIPYVVVYAGKSAEFITGIFLTLGLFTRPCSVLTMITFSAITFFVGAGRFWYEDQHPFMFALFGLLFFFTGPGDWSLDKRRQSKQ